jgi:hypothetical protein
MNPLRNVDWNWFWRTLLALMIALLVYRLANDPGLRPTDRIEPVPGEQW